MAHTLDRASERTVITDAVERRLLRGRAGRGPASALDGLVPERVERSDLECGAGVARVGSVRSDQTLGGGILIVLGPVERVVDRGDRDPVLRRHGSCDGGPGL